MASIQLLLNETNELPAAWESFITPQFTAVSAFAQNDSIVSFEKLDKTFILEISSKRSAPPVDRAAKKAKSLDGSPKVKTPTSTPTPFRNIPPKAWWFMRSLNLKQHTVPSAGGFVVEKKDSSLNMFTASLWMQQYQHLKKFKEMFGHCNIPSREEQWKSLSQWVRHQRRNRKQGKLNQEQEELLNELGLTWEKLTRFPSGLSDNIHLPSFSDAGVYVLPAPASALN